MAFQQIPLAWFNDAAPNLANTLLIGELQTDGTPTPMELQVDLRPSTGLTGFPPRATQLAAGSDTDAKLHAIPCGYLYLLCDNAAQGEPGNSRAIFADLASGRFSLGTYTRVRAYVGAWYGGVGQQLEVQGMVAPSDGSGDWLKYTVPITGLAASGSVTVRIPAGARYVELVDPAGQPGSGTTAINMSLTSRVVAQRNYQGGTLTPSWSPVAIQSRGGTAADESITVTNNDTANANDAALLFWLKP